MYMYIYNHMYIYTHKYICIYLIYTHVYIYVHTNIHIQTQALSRRMCAVWMEGSADAAALVARCLPIGMTSLVPSSSPLASAQPNNVPSSSLPNTPTPPLSLTHTHTRTRHSAIYRAAARSRR